MASSSHQFSLVNDHGGELQVHTLRSPTAHLIHSSSVMLPHNILAIKKKKNEIFLCVVIVPWAFISFNPHNISERRVLPLSPLYVEEG